MSTNPMTVLLRANRRAAELRREAAGDRKMIGPSVLIGAPSHTGAFLLTALDELGWELRPKTDDQSCKAGPRGVNAGPLATRGES